MTLHERFKDKLVDVRYETDYHFAIRYAKDTLTWTLLHKGVVSVEPAEN